MRIAVLRGLIPLALQLKNTDAPVRADLVEGYATAETPAMKFAKELERDAVPEWRINYLNYKAGKKYIKAVSRAINRTPKFSYRTSSYFRLSNYNRALILPTLTSGLAPRRTPKRSNRGPIPQSTPISFAGYANEDKALAGDGNNMRHRSFMPTPPTHSPLKENESKVHDFALPAPAIKAPELSELGKPIEAITAHSKLPLQLGDSIAAEPVTMRFKSLRSPSIARQSTVGGVTESPSQLRRILSHVPAPLDLSKDGALIDFDLVREREQEFYEFMDSELEKVESFYKFKEDQAGQQLSVLRQQLHEMRNRRIHEIATNPDNNAETSKDNLNGWVQPIKAKMFPLGPNSKALLNMPTTPYLPPSASVGDAAGDYSRQRQKDDIVYRIAKRKLKLALQEFYRGLELLKSYALLNQTAFRKLNKKFDKASNTQPTLQYMNEKVYKAWFVNSDTLNGHIKAVKDLYARYFERGNYKLAASKLQSLSKHSTSESKSSFLNGFLIGTGLIFSAKGLTSGSQLLFNANPIIRTGYGLSILTGAFC
ncbi:EXS family protein [Pochonia chlamydosporia 170]|uniref:EXS family protein n=1 Tax=Pochonia chlamydosporia 170 TaxID=1380566 RepID=A0A179F5V7_METCM|nr:EXS family protein [Pochonia chlamydosporia 170]OAQ60782.2 EXS family protein [Pochonia chlamydosporia 170]